ncbi:MAG: hypothetical protein Kow0058_19800 [Roseovarius sp.]
MRRATPLAIARLPRVPRLPRLPRVPRLPRIARVLILTLTAAQTQAAPAVAPPRIFDAHYAAPTTRYDHGVLGDAVEWGALVLRLADATTRRFTLPRNLVFEDTAPRLTDLDGDGAPEVVVVESSLEFGARLAVYGPSGRLAATPHIGQPHRWLAPVGAADLDGDGQVELAAIDRPHLARILRLWHYRDGTLIPVAEAPGFTNHRIGWDLIAGGVRQCGARAELILASGDWRQVLAVRLVAGQIERRVLGPYRGPDSLRAALGCP